MSRMIRPTRRKALNRAVRPLFAEQLEPRRLLTVAFDSATGVLTVTTGSTDDIIQFEAIGNADGITGFRVFESTAGAPLAGTSKQDFIDYIDAGINEVTSADFTVAAAGEVPGTDDVRRVFIETNLGDDLIIAGQKLPVPIEVNSGGGDDTVSGGPRADTILTEDGNDSIFGGEGDDVITGGANDDIFVGGAGNDSVDYRNRTDGVTITVDGVANDGDLVDGEADLVSDDIETIVGGTGDDFLQGGSIGSGVALIGNAGNDTLEGGDGDDTLVGGTGTDSLSGNAGQDFIFATDGEADIVDADDNDGGNNDVGEAGEDFVLGDASALDTFTGSTNEFVADETLSGLSPSLDDIEDGDADIDGGTLRLTGTGGDDRIEIFAFADGRVFATIRSLDGATTTGTISTELADVDAVVAVGLGGNDRIVAAGLGNVPITFDGGDGDDTLVGSSGSDTLLGGSSGSPDDEQTGGDDFLFGSVGNDVLLAGFGADYVAGGLGTDQVSYASRGEPIVVGLGVLADDGADEEGDDIQTDVEIVIGGNGNDRLSTISDLDVRLFGGPGNDTLTGGSGNDIFQGDAGNDQMFGLAGNDTFFADDNEADTLNGGTGTDTAASSDGLDTLISIE